VADPQSTDPDKRFAFLEDASMRRGAKWGMIVGFVIASYHISSNSPLGFYTGSVALVFGFCIGGGILAGLCIGWLVSRMPTEEP
jgi:hypothetical protein